MTHQPAQGYKGVLTKGLQCQRGHSFLPPWKLVLAACLPTVSGCLWPVLMQPRGWGQGEGTWVPRHGGGVWGRVEKAGSVLEVGWERLQLGTLPMGTRLIPVAMGGRKGEEPREQCWGLPEMLGLKQGEEH